MNKIHELPQMVIVTMTVDACKRTDFHPIVASGSCISKVNLHPGLRQAALGQCTTHKIDLKTKNDLYN